MRILLMQERAYSTYCSLKCSSIQGYLFQESYFTYGVAYLSWVDKRTGRHTRCKKCYAHYNGSEFMGEFDKYLQEIGIEQSAIQRISEPKNRQSRSGDVRNAKARLL